jgi:aromatic ring hydroxylase
MNGRDYIESLKDGREVWYDGERVPSVPDHPVLRRCVENRAREYDLHSDPKWREVLSFVDDGGDSRCIMYRIPQIREDLLAYRRALETALSRCRHRPMPLS